MSVHSEYFYAPSEAIPQIAEELHLILQNQYQITLQERRSQGHELQITKQKYLAFLGLGLSKTVYIFPVKGKIRCEISGGDLGELVLPGILAFVFFFIFPFFTLIFIACAVWGLKVKKDLDAHIFKEIEKLAEHYKEQSVSNGGLTPASEHKCRKCGQIIDSPGFCPECGTKVD